MLARLGPIGFTATLDQGGILDVNLPSWRPDCELEVDVIEEIARHVGYGRAGPDRAEVHRGRPAVAVPGPAPAGPAGPLRPGHQRGHAQPFLAPGDLTRAGLDPHGLAIANPLVAEESVLRTSLRPGLFKAVAFNAPHRNDDVALFEIGHTYRPAETPLPDEREALAVALAGRDGQAAVPVLNEVVAALGLAGRVRIDQVVLADQPGLHPGRTARIHADGVDVGVVGEVDPGVLDTYEIPGRLAWLELDSSTVLALEPAIPQWRPVSRFPSSDIDLAFVAGEDLAAQDVQAAIAAWQASSWPRSSCSTSIAARASSRASATWPPAALAVGRPPLTDAEVAQVRDQAIAAATEQGATLRGV